MQRRLSIIIIAVVIFIVVGIGFYFTFRRTLIADIREAALAPDMSDPVAYGEVLFDTRGCINCHTLDAVGATGDEGPSLNGIGSRAGEGYLHMSITQPEALIVPTCPEGPCEPIMPDYGNILNETQVEALIAFLSEQK